MLNVMVWIGVVVVGVTVHFYEVGSAVNESFVNTNDSNDYAFLLIVMLIIIFLYII